MAPAKYQDVANELRRRIATRQFPPGASLPSESVIAATFNCKRDTVRAAIAELVREGLLCTARGRTASVKAPLDKATVALPAGAEVNARPATRPEAEAHGWSPGLPVFEISLPGLPALIYPAEAYTLTTPTD
ncbi:GntR family transcriptional regulator [Dactylosporangium sp. AC04546]|uniref:GntR family transcriptional regulator n=1 Tax=Dactylosporangium sp. AC04546 TaxID=2862460 RepID=UPI001EDD2A6E|nr:GntR family transcriptional regulator [Dactylosporangium sp. AC04546]WVK83651.1 GntR family transcriptional regulator [Dactylosporangium sp. AC04546]